MFEKYSYKIKFNALLLLTVILGITANKRSFRPLYEVYIENQRLNDKISLVKKQIGNVDLLKSQIKNLDNIIGNENVSKTEIQRGIVDFLNDNSKNLAINDLKSVHEFEDENFKIYTCQLDLTGNFNALLQLAYLFEKKFTYSKIVNYKFHIEKKGNQKEILHLTLIFQNYENTKE